MQKLWIYSRHLLTPLKIQSTKPSFALLKHKPFFPKLELNIVVKSTVNQSRNQRISLALTVQFFYIIYNSKNFPRLFLANFSWYIYMQWNFIIKLWALQDVSTKRCILCNSSFTNVSEHVTSSFTENLKVRLVEYYHLLTQCLFVRWVVWYVPT